MESNHNVRQGRRVGPATAASLKVNCVAAINILNNVGKDESKQKRRPALDRTPLGKKQFFSQQQLNRFRTDACTRWCRSGTCKRTGSGFLLGGLVDFDGALKVGAVFDHDSRGGQV